MRGREEVRALGEEETVGRWCSVSSGGGGGGGSLVSFRIGKGHHGLGRCERKALPSQASGTSRF